MFVFYPSPPSCQAKQARIRPAPIREGPGRQAVAVVPTGEVDQTAPPVPKQTSNIQRPTSNVELARALDVGRWALNVRCFFFISHLPPPGRDGIAVPPVFSRPGLRDACHRQGG